MRLAFISDVHANLEALEATLADIAPCAVDRVVCLGDIVGYNTRPAECIALIRRINAICVAGNHDLAVCGRMQIKGFGNTAARAVAWTQRRLAQSDLNFLSTLSLKVNVNDEVLAVHGALHPESDCATVRLDSDDSRMKSFQALMADASGARICAFGHTHHAAVFEFRRGRAVARPEEKMRLQEDAYYLINPGSVGQPRGRERRASYMIVDLEQRMLSRHLVDYDAAVPLAATRQAGLAPAFSFVPAPIRGTIAAALRQVGLDRPVRHVAALLGL